MDPTIVGAWPRPVSATAATWGVLVCGKASRRSPCNPRSTLAWLGVQANVIPRPKHIRPGRLRKPILQLASSGRTESGAVHGRHLMYSSCLTL